VDTCTHKGCLGLGKKMDTCTHKWRRIWRRQDLREHEQLEVHGRSPSRVLEQDQLEVHGGDDASPGDRVLDGTLPQPSWQ
jgi:hypothetical protein